MGLLLKFVMLGVAAYVAWTTAKRWFGLLGGGNRQPPPPVDRRSAADPAPGPVQAPRRPIVEDTRACPVCAAYVSVSASKCGRPDCPQP
ncbi:MAG: hypothetical protein JOY81_13885 [Alphaproteobacteria bacterium]|nr:hypothetical protein [Alphaproteobacteria bacterium]